MRELRVKCICLDGLDHGVESPLEERPIHHVLVHPS